MRQSVACDVAIIGGGIAGLWLANQLKRLGYSFVLCEQSALGAGQTRLSQGILHGGTKYALTGKLTQSAAGVAEMPAIWQACLEGKGDIDLQGVQVNSRQHYLWTVGGRYTSQLKSFVSSKVLSGDSAVLDKTEYPPILQHPDAKGSLCAVNEWVLDIPNLLQALRQPIKSQLLQCNDGAKFVYQNGVCQALDIQQDGKVCEIKAKHYVCLAGEGNKALLTNVPHAPKMQVRPLQMVWATFPEDSQIEETYLHIVEKGTVPTLTITSHRTEQGRLVWYMGGSVAEQGTDMSAEQLIGCAKAEVKRLLPWVDLTGVSWSTTPINRAEGAQPGNKRPPSCCYYAVDEHVGVGWPTKLVLAPALALQALEHISCEPSQQSVQPDWPLVDVAKPIWSEA